MSQLLNQPQSGVGNGGELLACITDLGPVGQRPVPLLCEHLVAVLCKCFLGTKCMQKWDGMEGTVADRKKYIYTFAVAFLESHLSLTPAIQPFFILAGLKGKTHIQRWNTLTASKHLSSFVPWGSAGRLEERCKMARSAKDLWINIGLILEQNTGWNVVFLELFLNSQDVQRPFRGISPAPCSPCPIGWSRPGWIWNEILILCFVVLSGLRFIIISCCRWWSWWWWKPVWASQLLFRSTLSPGWVACWLGWQTWEYYPSLIIRIIWKTNNITALHLSIVCHKLMVKELDVFIFSHLQSNINHKWKTWNVMFGFDVFLLLFFVVKFHFLIGPILLWPGHSPK